LFSSLREDSRRTDGKYLKFITKTVKSNVKAVGLFLTALKRHFKRQIKPLATILNRNLQLDVKNKSPLKRSFYLVI